MTIWTDFVAIKRHEKKLQIKDAYPEMVIVRTRHDEYQNEGVRIVDISDWLLK